MRPDVRRGSAGRGEAAGSGSERSAFRLLQGRLVLDQVAEAAAGGDEILAELPPDVGDVHVEQVRHAVFVLVKQMIVQHRTGDELPAMQDQELDERIFGRREVGGFPP